MDIAVLGAGANGRAIGERCLRAGHEVRLHAEDAADAMDAVDVIERRLEDAVAASEVTDAEAESVAARLEATTGLEAAVSGSDLVIETGATETDQLQADLARVEEFVDRDTLVTTSSGAVPVTAAAAGLRHPDRALGLYFHRPLGGGLVEIVVADQTTGAAVEDAREFVEGLEMQSIVARDNPGVTAERLALAQEAEAMRLVAEGTAGVEAVDTAMTRGYEHPRGPLERADRAGLAERLETLAALSETLGSRFDPPPLLGRLVEEGATGLDAGEGFYVWEDGDPVEPALDRPDLTEGAGRRHDPTRG